jgi:hypothetical protein
MVLYEGLPIPTKKSDIPQEIYQIKVTLLDTSIWRRLLAPADMTLTELHDVLQVAMGWEGEHMHEFSIGRRQMRRRVLMPPVENESTTHLSSLLGRVGAQATYTYDFGDNWEHGIVLEKRLSADPNTAYPVCAGGQFARPPEDCGGVGRFYDLLDAFKDPNHDRHEEALEWFGDDFDSEAFSVEDVNRMVARMYRRRRKASGT